MASEFSGIIAQLERQKAAIERALAALHGLDGNAPAESAASASRASAPAKRKRGMSPEGKRRLIAALKKRWAAKKAAAAAQAAPAPAATPARLKVRFTPEGRKRLAEAMRRRWAVKRAAAQARKVGRKAA